MHNLYRSRMSQAGKIKYHVTSMQISELERPAIALLP